MHYVYVLFSQIGGKSYVGMTDNLVRRLREHNDGRHSYTKRYVPWKIIYTEELASRIEARNRERYLKSAAGRNFLKKQIFSN